MNRVIQISPYSDINGKNICEGDIIRVTTTFIRKEVPPRISIVEVKFGEYADGEGYMTDTHCGWHTKAGTLPDIHSRSEIIGDIYQNPELLTKQNK